MFHPGGDDAGRLGRVGHDPPAPRELEAPVCAHAHDYGAPEISWKEKKEEGKGMI